MDTKKQVSDFESWHSSYGMLTVERILEYLQVSLSRQQLLMLLNKPEHSLHKLLRLPMLNIFNGVIMQQAYDYQVYAQKLMIDYRLSPEFSKDEDAPGEHIRQDLSVQYDQLLILTHAFSEEQYNHYYVIAESQRYLIESTSSLNDILNQLDELLKDEDFANQYLLFRLRAEEITVNFKTYRQSFYDMILTLMDRLALLPEYHFNVNHIIQEREALLFDKHIGG